MYFNLYEWNYFFILHTGIYLLIVCNYRVHFHVILFSWTCLFISFSIDYLVNYTGNDCQRCLAIFPYAQFYYFKLKSLLIRISVFLLPKLMIISNLGILIDYAVLVCNVLE